MTKAIAKSAIEVGGAERAGLAHPAFVHAPSLRVGSEAKGSREVSSHYERLVARWRREGADQSSIPGHLPTTFREQMCGNVTLTHGSASAAAACGFRSSCAGRSRRRPRCYSAVSSTCRTAPFSYTP